MFFKQLHTIRGEAVLQEPPFHIGTSQHSTQVSSFERFALSNSDEMTWKLDYKFYEGIDFKLCVSILPDGTKKS